MDKPATGEWTVQSINALCRNTAENAAYVIAEAHNAALAQGTDAAVQEMLLIKQQLAAERSGGQWRIISELLKAELDTEREDREKAWKHWQEVIEGLRDQLAAEREKYKRSQEKVREYFNLLAAEREKVGKT